MNYLNIQNKANTPKLKLFNVPIEGKGKKKGNSPIRLRCCMK